MTASALQLYDDALRSGEHLHVARGDGQVEPLDLARWLAPADSVDLDALARAEPPVLDIGCGPGRVVAGLAERGMLCLGIDIAPAAVVLTRGRGLNALRRNVFGHVPGAGRWRTVVLFDGNIGIGGDPETLLRRISTLLVPTGRVLVEVSPDGMRDERDVLRFVRAGRAAGSVFPWAFVGTGALAGYADRTGFTIAESWTSCGRAFVCLDRSAR